MHDVSAWAGEGQIKDRGQPTWILRKIGARKPAMCAFKRHAHGLANEQSMSVQNGAENATQKERVDGDAAIA
jgi:hypothetical protein